MPLVSAANYSNISRYDSVGAYNHNQSSIVPNYTGPVVDLFNPVTDLDRYAALVKEAVESSAPLREAMQQSAQKVDDSSPLSAQPGAEGDKRYNIYINYDMALKMPSIERDGYTVTLSNSLAGTPELPKTVTADMLNRLDSDFVKALKHDVFNALTAREVGELNETIMLYMSDAARKGLSEDFRKNLSAKAKFWLAVLEEDLPKADADAGKKLNAAQLNALSVHKLWELGPDAFNDLSAEELSKLNHDIFGCLSIDTLQGLSAYVLNNLSKNTINNLPSHLLHMIPHEYTKLSQFVLDNLSPKAKDGLKALELNILPDNVIARLGAGRFNRLPDEALKYFNGQLLNKLSGAALAGLGADLFNKLPVSQLSKVEKHVFEGLSKETVQGLNEYVLERAKQLGAELA